MLWCNHAKCRATRSKAKKKFKENTKKMKELEEITLVLSEKVLPIEEVKQAEKDHFRCTLCDFQSTSKAGLKIHMKRKHTGAVE